MDPHQTRLMNPLALDLCCGKGGWALGLMEAGWDVVGVDLADFSADYPGSFIQADLLQWDPAPYARARLVVASPPCEEFSRHSMPWTRARNPPPPSLALVDRCRAIAGQLGCPIILENVRGAQPWLGRSVLNCGPFHLWGDVPALIPTDAVYTPKQTLWSDRRTERAMVPRALARWIGECFLP